MIQYSIAFSLNPDVDELSTLATVHVFLRDLQHAGEIDRFRVLKNSGEPPKSRMLPFQAQIEFRNGAQFSAAFAAQATRGIHNGLHGRVMSAVAEFQIEIFRQVCALETAPLPETARQFACEV